MPAIILNAVSFSYGSHRVLDRVSLHISDGERAFLIGPNGSGKSTLLKIVTGELPPDSGRVASAASSQSVPQADAFHGTVGDFLDAALAPLTELSARFDQVASALANAGAGLDAEYDRLLAQMSAHDVWALDARVGEMLDGFGLGDLGEAIAERDVSTLSPGQRARLTMAALLILRPEALILDEPTNHLDAQAISFLAHTVRNWHGPVLATSHDRAFIEDVATAIYDMDITVWRELARADGEEGLAGLHRNAGDYTAYLQAKAVAQARHAQIHAVQQAHKRELREHRHESMRIARGGVRVGTAVGKEKKFFTDRAAATSVKRTRNDDVRLERLAEQEVRKPRHYQLEFPTHESRAGSGVVVAARRASVHGRLAPVSCDLSAGEHLLVTGSNGAGKSTLLTWIATGAPPADARSSGSIRRDEPIGVVPQRLPIEGDPGLSPEAWRSGIGDLGKGILHPSMWATPIPELSAGNQRRAQLAIALAANPALLIVDEPTNYLDLDTMHALDEALRHWSGTLILASHDRWLIEHWHGRRLRLDSLGADHDEGPA